MRANVKQTPITILLLTLTTLVFLMMQLLYPGAATSSQVVFDFGGLFGRYVMVEPSNLWRLVTPIFVHIGWDHFIMNSLALYFVGIMAEQVWGSARFLALYLLSGIMGNLWTLLVTPDVVSAGASTSLFGLFAAFVIVGYFGNNTYLKQLGRSYAVLIGINLFFNLFMTNVGMVGHIGGALGGALIGFGLIKDFARLSKKWQYLALAAYLVVALGILTLVYVQ